MCHCCLKFQKNCLSLSRSKRRANVPILKKNSFVRDKFMRVSNLHTAPKRHFVSIPNDTSNSIRVYMGDWGLKDHREWKSHSGLKLVSDSCTNNFIFPAILALHLNTWIKLPILQTIFISAIMNVDLIPSFIQEWNFDPSLHDFESTFHSGSSVQSGSGNLMPGSAHVCMI